ncbi:hypothetical protein CCP3SC5AM1_1730004 [Gammaproteobacteria bacterium]
MLKKFISRLLISLWLFSLFLPVIQASETDLVMLVDNSGSMKKHDPNFFLRQVITSFTDQLDFDTNLALFSFEREAIPLFPISSARSHERIRDAIQRISYRGSRTDIADAVEKAIYLLKNQGRPRAAKAILLLTDGYMDTGNIARDRDKTRWLLHELAEECVENRIRLFGIAFTESADYQLLQSLAWRTRGDYFRVFDHKEMRNAFHRIQEQIVPSVSSIATPTLHSPKLATSVAPVPENDDIASTNKPFITSPQSSSIATSAVIPLPMEAASLPPPTIEMPLRPKLTTTLITEDAKKNTKALISEEKKEAKNNVIVDYPQNISHSSALDPPSIALPKAPTSQPLSAIKTIKNQLIKENNPNESDAGHLGWWLIVFFVISIIILEIKKRFNFLRTIVQNSINRKWINTNWIKPILSKFSSFNKSSTGSLMDETLLDSYAVDDEILNKTIKFQIQSYDISKGIKNNIPIKEEKKEDKKTENAKLSVSSLSKLESSSVLAKLIDRRGTEGIGEFSLTRTTTIISRSSDWEQSNIAHLQINAATISRRHAIIEFRDFSFWLRDLGSSNGTYVNHQRIKEDVKLKNNDFIQFHTFGFDFISFFHEEEKSTYRLEIDKTE